MKKKEILLSAAAVLLSLAVVVTGCSLSERMKENLGDLVESLMNVSTAAPSGEGTEPFETDPSGSDPVQSSPEHTDPVPSSEPAGSSSAEETPENTEAQLAGTRTVAARTASLYEQLVDGVFTNQIGQMEKGAAGVIEEAGEGWLKIRSGQVTGYADASAFLTGEEAEKADTEVPFAVVDVESLRLREEPSSDAKTIAVLRSGDCYRVLSEKGAYTELRISPELSGFVESIHVVTAKKELEAQSLAEISQEIMAGDKLIWEQEVRESVEASIYESSVQESIAESSRIQESIDQSIAQSLHDATERETDEYDMLSRKWEPVLPDDISDLRRHICLLACHYVKELKYVEGGSSLTTGCDSPGFAKAIYGHFGYILPPTSKSQASCGREVASFDDIRPGDLIVYKGSVGIYVGGGYIVRAGMEGFPANKDKYDYKEIVSIRNIVGD